jgi:hypothetical protein
MERFVADGLYRVCDFGTDKGIVDLCFAAEIRVGCSGVVGWRRFQMSIRLHWLAMLWTAPLGVSVC